MCVANTLLKKSYVLVVFMLFCILSEAQLRERPKGSTSVDLGYIEYLPVGYNESNKEFPMLISFHGIGEGTDAKAGKYDLKKLYNAGIPNLIKNGKWPVDRKFIVIAPQHESLSNCFFVDEIDHFIEQVTALYKVDKRRIYVTGYSCGAIGLWNFIGQFPDNNRIAGAVLICGDGRGSVNWRNCAINIPVWAFHGSLDKTVNPAGSVDAITKLKLCPEPRKEAKLTLYDGVGHDSWTRTYNGSAGHDIYTWLMYFSSPLPVTTGVNETSGNRLSGREVFPNPAEDFVVIRIPEDEVTDTDLTITDFAGNQVYQNRITSAETRIGTDAFSPGMYFVKMGNEKSTTYYKFLKK